MSLRKIKEAIEASDLPAAKEALKAHYSIYDRVQGSKAFTDDQKQESKRELSKSLEVLFDGFFLTPLREACKEGEDLRSAELLGKAKVFLDVISQEIPPLYRATRWYLETAYDLVYPFTPEQTRVINRIVRGE